MISSANRESISPPTSDAPVVLDYESRLNPHLWSALKPLIQTVVLVFVPFFGFIAFALLICLLAFARDPDPFAFLAASLLLAAAAQYAFLRINNRNASAAWKVQLMGASAVSILGVILVLWPSSDLFEPFRGLLDYWHPMLPGADYDQTYRYPYFKSLKVLWVLESGLLWFCFSAIGAYGSARGRNAIRDAHRLQVPHGADKQNDEAVAVAASDRSN